MKARGVLLFAVLALVIAGAMAAAQEKPPEVATAIPPQNAVVARWDGRWEVQGGVHSGKSGTASLTITSSQGGRIRGSLLLTGLIGSVDGPVTGKMNGNDLALDRWPLPYGTLTLYLTLRGDTMEGSFSYGTMANHMVNFTRVK